MAEKRFYWLKLKEDYFNNPKIKKLRKIAGGDTYTIIYLKMQLLSVKTGGIIQFEEIEPTFYEELALKLDEDVENVQVTLNYLKMQGLIEENENNEFLVIEASNNIGSEGQSAERKRLFDKRKQEKLELERQKVLQSNASVTEVKRNSISNSISNSNSISSINNNKEVKHKYGEYNNVLITDSELDKLKQEYGEDNTKEAIRYLDEYIEMKGYKAKSHYLAIRKWVMSALKEQVQRAVIQNKQKKQENIMEMANRIDSIIDRIK